MSLKNLKSGIPPRARLMIFLTVSVLIVMTLVLMKVFFSKDTASQLLPDSSVQVDLRPSSIEIEKGRINNETTAPKGSELEKEFLAIREGKIDSAKKSNSTYLETLRFNNAELIASERADDVPSSTRVTGLDKKSGLETDDQAIARLQQERRLAYNASASSMQSEQSPGSKTLSAHRLMDGAIFLQAEIDASRVDAQSLANGISGLRQVPGKIYVVQNDLPDHLAEKRNASITGNAEDQANYTDDYLAIRNGITGSEGGASSDAKQNDINVGDLFYAVLQMKVNSDNTKTIFATIVQEGLLKNAVLMGKVERINDKVELTFSHMGANKRSYSVSAIGVDPSSLEASLADSVNYHTIERYGKLGLAAFISGYADALSTTNTTVGTDGSVFTRTDPLPDSNSQIKVASGQVGKSMVPIFEKEFDRPPTVIVNKKPIGIRFIEPLTL